MTHRSISRIALAMIALIAALGGCAPRQMPIDNIACHYTFTGVEGQGERDRVTQAITKYAKPGTVTPSIDPFTGTMEVGFVVDRFARLDPLNAELLFPGMDSAQPRFNTNGPAFNFRYDSVSLGASIDMILHFHVTPGSMLWYKPQGEHEKDITDQVGPTGEVRLPVTIRKGEDYIYARINSGNIDKYIRINVYSHQVETIPKSGY